MADGRRTYDTSTVRRRNRRTVLDELRALRTTTRPALATSTGLTVPTVRALLDDLIRCGLAVEDAAIATGGIGRPATSISYPARDLSIGVVQFGPTYQRVALADGTGTELGFWSDRAEHRPESAVGRATAELDRLVAEADARLVTTVAIVPGRVVDDRVDSAVLGWHDLDVGDLVRSGTGVDNVVVNATVAGGTAELLEGVGTTTDRFALIDSGNDVSLVVYVHGRLVTVDPIAVGELPIGPETETTVTDVAGAFPLVDRYREAGGSGATSAGAIFAEAVAGGAAALQAVGGAIRTLAYAVRWVSAIAKPDVVVVGGGLGSLDVRARELVVGLLAEHTDTLPPVRFSEVAAPGWIRGGVLLGVDRVRALEDRRIADTIG